MIDSAEEFVRLRTSDDPQDYNRAAGEHAREAVWLEMLGAYPDMRRWVAHNKTVPLAVLARLAKDEDGVVREAVAAKRKLTAELFEQLSRDPSPAVRERIAWNAKTPQSVLLRLADDRVEQVAAAAQQRPTDHGH